MFYQTLLLNAPWDTLWRAQHCFRLTKSKMTENPPSRLRAVSQQISFKVCFSIIIISISTHTQFYRCPRGPNDETQSFAVGSPKILVKNRLGENQARTKRIVKVREELS